MNRSSASAAILSPEVLEQLPTLDLAETVREAIAQHNDIDCAHFQGGEASALEGNALEFSGCLLERCRFSNWELRRVSFVDCVFDHCDLSGLRLADVTFQRVSFRTCRLTGVEWLHVSLMNVTLSDCAADYLILSDAKLNRVAFRGCHLRESVWQEIQVKNLFFQDCDLTSTQILQMPMEGLDMTTCTLDNLRIDPHDLRGMRVSALQALQFCAMLGLRIVEQ